MIRIKHAALGAAVMFTAAAAHAAVGVDSSALEQAVTVDSLRSHLQALQAIADANGGSRASGTPGYDASVDYVAGTLAAAGYQVTRQEFSFDLFEELAPAMLEQISPTPGTYDVLVMEYSGSGDVTAALQPVDVTIDPSAPANTSTSGCEAADFAGFVPGNIALIQRGTCPFYDKAANAEAAGAVGAIIFNEGQAGRTEMVAGTLGASVGIPAVGLSFADGAALVDQTAAGEVVMHLFASTSVERRDTFNVIAETPGGRDDRVVVAGAHLDSVGEGPGIEDNGTGSATILEVALQMSELGIEPRNKVRFAFWGAEESGLIGSTYYVSQLDKRAVKDIAVNLNFDMVGSPNYVRFVYDGDGSATPAAGPNGSDVVEGVFLDYFASRGLATEPTAFDGRSDYGPFIAVGIPAGGLFTGAEGIKTEVQAQVYGGTAGLAYDPCYHQACDDIDNISWQALDEMSDAAAHAVLTFAMTTSSVSGTAQASAKAVESTGMLYKGNHLQR
ncbi:MAG TPA: M28 family metallopeptidase [Arenibaculum sp.]|nr:M28 family metallopeptidase [Arenibaculum sp.]